MTAADDVEPALVLVERRCAVEPLHVDIRDEVLQDLSGVKYVSVLDHGQVNLVHCVQVRTVLDSGVAVEVKVLIAYS